MSLPIPLTAADREIRRRAVAVLREQVRRGLYRVEAAKIAASIVEYHRRIDR